jgi:bifunctional UDP-N-acetylglucosamine pyrophosphorylase / glucosamine-1-phosphate N-acetyltransferase
VSGAPAQALVLAAGKGVRMKSRRAKVLHEALGLSLLGHVLRTVEALGADPVGVVVGHRAEDVEAAFAGHASFLRQEPPLGTGHAVQVAGEHVSRHPERPLLVLSGDVPLLRLTTVEKLLTLHRESAAAATLLTAELAEPGAYGRVLRDESGGVRAIVEARDATPAERAVREINAGVYVFDVPALLGVLGRLRPQNAQGEYYLTDVVGLLAAEGRRLVAWTTEDPLEGRGVNTLAELAEITRILRSRRVAELMAAGVVIEDPETTVIGLDVRIEADAVIRPFTVLEGRSFVAAEAVVGPYVRMVDAEVRQGAQVFDHCFLRDCIVGAGAVVGPFAHIRPDSVIGPRAKVGNFVELKKTHLGEGSKAPHLSYLGDATIGPAVNVGAGTITCNYDGVNKHPTRIGAGAFIGSDTTLVAPITVGEGAYVAAGSAITEDVPADALALGRARQVIKEGWAAARRAKRAGSGAKHS